MSEGSVLTGGGGCGVDTAETVCVATSMTSSANSARFPRSMERSVEANTMRTLAGSLTTHGGRCYPQLGRVYRRGVVAYVEEVV